MPVADPNANENDPTGGGVYLGAPGTAPVSPANPGGPTVTPPGGTPPPTAKPDGTIENGGIWYQGHLYSPEDRYALRGTFGPNQTGWLPFLNANPAFLSWWNAAEQGAGTATNPTTGAAGGTSDGTIDWENVLGDYGLPPDVIAQLNVIWKAAAGDVNKAVTLAQAYVRGTDWYKATYPGIDQGENAGLFGDERGYRAYQNQINQLYSQYFGRLATSAEVSGYIMKGQAASQVANQLQSQAAQGTITDPLKALFTPDELKALTDEQAGIDTALGQQILQKANLAVGVGQLYQAFYGRSMTRAELDTITAQGLDPAAVARNFATQSNLNAMNPAVAGLFTPDELQQMAVQAAGGVTQHGQALTDMAQLAAQLNQVYQTYHGTNVTRDELNQAYTAGYTATQVANVLQTKSVLGSLPSYLGGLFTPEQLQTISQQQSGETDTAEGRTLLQLAQSADSYNAVYQSYMGRNISLSELSQYVNGDVSPTQVGNQLQAGNFAGALPADVAAMFTPEQLSLAANQSSGSLQSAEGARQLAIVQSAGAYHAVASQYNQPLTGDQLAQFYDQGISPTTYAQKAQGSAYAAAYGPQIQQTAGAFGEGQLSTGDLQTFGEETAGLDTPQGQKLAAAYQKAQARMNGVFRGVLASPTAFGSALGHQKTDVPDVAA